MFPTVTKKINLKFYLTSTSVFLIFAAVGFFVGKEASYNFLIHRFGDPYGEEILGFFVYISVFSIFCSVISLLIGLMLIHKLGKRWGPQLSFGSHPVLKLTFLSFLTFLGLLVLLLFLIPTN